MTKFKGFTEGKINITMVHTQFISEIVPLIKDLAELKVCLFCYYALAQKEGDYRYLTREDFANNSELMQGLQAIHGYSDSTLDNALHKAVKHGFLLCKTVIFDQQDTQLYFMNTIKSRAMIDDLEAGKWQPLQKRFEVLPNRSNLFDLYEQNIGMLTATVADDIQDAERDYPHEWIVEALELAVSNNIRNWKYISKILESWQSEGKDTFGAANIELTTLYRDNFDYKIGSVMTAELQEAQARYPHDWIVDAMRLAVTNNVKRWTYVKSVLAHWQQDGREQQAPNSVLQYYRENFDYNIGTVMRAELEEAQSKFDDDWILAAMKIALDNNVKRWTYVRIILERWKQEGRSDEKSERLNQRTNEYAGLNWSDFASE